MESSGGTTVLELPQMNYIQKSRYGTCTVRVRPNIEAPGAGAGDKRGRMTHFRSSMDDFEKIQKKKKTKNN
jgi:hypothetical protein